jgi:apolipoprotein D and lipocalin family protein
MNLIKQFLVVAVLASAAICTLAQTPVVPVAPPPPLMPIQSIDLARYQGVWHQVALYPNRFQKMCASNTRATYALEEGGTVQVTNQCRSADGKESQVVGQARPARAAQVSQGQLAPPQLQVRFAPAWLSWLPMVWGDYWVIQLGDDYRYAVVGEPKREFLWVLARETQLSATDWSMIDARLKEQGYDPAKLVREKHLP